MRKYSGLYEQICAWENLERAYRRARTPFPSPSDGGAPGEGKRGQAPAADFERLLEDNLVQLHNDLLRNVEGKETWQVSIDCQQMLAASK